MTKQPISVKPTESLSDVLYLLNRYKLSRLPVVQSNKLVGIITRTDIIRVEVDQLNNEAVFNPIPSYTCYKTRSPALGKGRILVPITIDDDHDAIFAIASNIAIHYNYEIEFCSVKKISKHIEPRTCEIDWKKERKLMETLEAKGKEKGIPIHADILIARNRISAILEVIKKRHINFLVMLWNDKNNPEEIVFSSLIDQIINKAPCELILVKLGKNQQYYPYHHNNSSSCLIPMAGGPNAQEGLNLLPALLSQYQNNLPSIWLAKVFSPSEQELDCSDLDSAAEHLKEKIDTTINSLCIRSHSVVNAISRLAKMENCNLVILGASKESLLQKTIHGNIPRAIALKLDTTVIIVRLPS